MKNKLFIAVALLMLAGSISAQSYKTAIGGVVGMTNGVSAKHFFSDNVALQADLGFGIRYSAFSSYGYSFTASYWDFHITPNVVYQKDFASFGGGALAFYAGGGLTLGETNNYTYNSCFGGIFGINAIGGLEYNFSQPVSLGFDFRPGYGLLFDLYGTLSVFDWSLNISVRYRL